MRAGLKVSPQGLCQLSIWFQFLTTCGLVLQGLILGMLLRAVLPTVGAGFHIFNLIIVYKAQFRRQDYPWHVLKWTFPVGAAAYSLTAISALARTMSDMERVLVFPIVWFAIVYLLPACLQTALLWWPRIENETVGGLEPSRSD
jgi:hypothetical protein